MTGIIDLTTIDEIKSEAVCNCGARSEIDMDVWAAQEYFEGIGWNFKLEHGCPECRGE
jgi:hypothetical protein